MPTCWYEWLPMRWRGEQEIARRYMQDVTVETISSGHAAIAGLYRLFDRCGHLRDTFALRIVYPPDFLPPPHKPLEMPRHHKIFLDSHRNVWVNGLHTHILDDWSLCLYVHGESGIDLHWPDSLEHVFESLHTFLTKQFFYQQDLRAARQTGAVVEWPGPARGHRLDGLREAVDAIGGLGGDDPCICGSGRPFRECHQMAIQFSCTSNGKDVT